MAKSNTARSASLPAKMVAFASLFGAFIAFVEPVTAFSFALVATHLLAQA
jgi:hypothetical protein